jgi:hypothetical protein
MSDLPPPGMCARCGAILAVHFEGDHDFVPLKPAPTHVALPRLVVEDVLDSAADLLEVCDRGILPNNDRRRSLARRLDRLRDALVAHHRALGVIK